jgi:hypothetical protein
MIALPRPLCRADVEMGQDGISKKYDTEIR